MDAGNGPGARSLGPFSSHRRDVGMTLVELMLAAALLAVGITALLGAFLGQLTLNEHARNLTWGMNDASRVMERLRQLNSGCAAGTLPSAVSTVGASWDAWLADTSANGGGGKSVQNVNELVVVTCRDLNGGALQSDYCATNQTGSGEWHTKPVANTSLDPINVSVAVCWRHRERVIGECSWINGTLSASDADGDGVVESPAMLTTLMTCRS